MCEILIEYHLILTVIQILLISLEGPTPRDTNCRCLVSKLKLWFLIEDFAKTNNIYSFNTFKF